MSSPTHHALLSASSAHCWLSAPPLPRLEQYFPHPISTAAGEGTAAHALGEYKIHRALGHKFKRLVSDYQSDEMESHTDDYCAYALEQYETAKQYAKDPSIYIEQKLDFSKYVPEGFGTGDCVIVSDHLLHIIDFKYGKGVKVEATNNPKMKLYAIGALTMFGNLYDIDEVETTIFQPRIANINTWSINAKDLMHWKNGDSSYWVCTKHLNDAKSCPVTSVWKERIKFAWMTMMNKLHFSWKFLLEPFIEDLADGTGKEDLTENIQK